VLFFLASRVSAALPRGQVDQVIEIGARKIQWPFIFHEEEITLPQCLTALDALQIMENGKDYEVLRRRILEFGFALLSLHAFNLTRVGILCKDRFSS
jgi:hypothetical protein